MQRRFLFSGLLAAFALSAAACTDETPTLTGDDEFPSGSIPVTREVILPASAFFEPLGTFTGYNRASDAPFMVIANQYGGALQAHGLVRFANFPATVTYQRSGVQKSDGAFTYRDSKLILDVDTAATVSGAMTVQVWAAAQPWERTSATWTTAIDTGAVETPWAEPGGTRGDLLAQGVFTNGPSGDSLVLTITAAAVKALADTAIHGVVVTTSTPGARIQLQDLRLVAAVRPDSAIPDTTINIAVTSLKTTVFTPEPPAPPAGYFAVGGIRGARALFELRDDQPVPGCAVGQTCADVPLRDVLLNDIALLLRPGPVPLGFDPLGRTNLVLRLVEEPELGAAAPLGSGFASGVYTEGDSLVTLGLNLLAQNRRINDSLPTTFALVSQSANTDGPPSFGVVFFQNEPRLRIVYTLPARRRLP